MFRHLIPILLALTACGRVDYDDAPVGRFDGSLLVMWVGAERFVYVPSPSRPLVFHRGDPGAAVQTIRPEMMYTDGGSIPRAARLFNGFSPWGYAPAYMVHDWLFVARHCLTDGTPTEAETAVAGIEFAESARIIAEAIKTLIASNKVKPDDVAPRVISGAVAGPFAYRSWVAEGACQRVSDAHREEVDAAFARAAGLRMQRGVRPATIVAEISF